MLASLYHAVFYQKKQIIQIHVDGKIYGMICLICYHFYNIWKHTKCWHLLWIPYSIKYAYSSELQTQENGYSGKGGRGKLQWPPLQYSGLETPMDGGAWWAAVHGVVRSRTRLSDFTFTFHFHALEKEMATLSSVLAWRIPGTGEPGGLPSLGSHKVGHDWSNLAVASVIPIFNKKQKKNPRQIQETVKTC